MLYILIISVTSTLKHTICRTISTFHIFEWWEQHWNKLTLGTHQMMIPRSRGYQHLGFSHLMTPTKRHHLTLWMILTPKPFIVLALVLGAVFLRVTLIVLRHVTCCKHFDNLGFNTNLIMSKKSSPLKHNPGFKNLHPLIINLSLWKIYHHLMMMTQNIIYDSFPRP